METDRKVVIHYSQNCVCVEGNLPASRVVSLGRISLKFKVVEVVQQSLNVCEPHCSEFQPFMITHFYTISLIFCDWFW